MPGATNIPNVPVRAALRMPVLSICVTTYNRSRWLAHSLPRILEQTRPYPDLVEVVVCDNASTDATPEVAARFSDWPNLRIHRNPRNVGMLGNLAVSATQGRGEYIWVIGDDDLMVDGALDRILAAIAVHPDVDLIYTNYAFTRFDRPENLAHPQQVIRGGAAASPRVRDDYVTQASQIAAHSDNCFTAIYCVVLRAAHAVAAYGQDTSGPPFSSLATCVPSTLYVVDHLFDRPAYWVGDPCVVVNMNVSWGRYRALYALERFPEIFDRMEQHGAGRAQIDELRVKHVGALAPSVREIYFGAQREHLPLFSMERLVSRFGHLPDFARAWPALRELYARAHREERTELDAPPPERLDAVVRERSRRG
jgi:hypothetical protein